jgi:nucleoside phosphorylase
MKPTIGIITALPKEHAAVSYLLENMEMFKILNDNAIYSKGYLKHKSGERIPVVLACCTKYANNPASIAVTNLIRSFPSIKDIVIVGIAAGVPRPQKPSSHVRLGDIIISSGTGVVQFDLGAQHSADFEVRSTAPPPSARLLQAVNLLESKLLTNEFSWHEYINNFLYKAHIIRPSKEPKKTFKHPKDPGRLKNIPKIFKGKIGASNAVIKNAARRDFIANEHNLLLFHQVNIA